MCDKLWLQESVKLLQELAKEYDLQELWKDFLLWAAFQAGKPYDMERAEKVVAKYPDEVVWEFGCLYSLIEIAVKKDPHQNVLLKIMWTLHLASHYMYDESKAEKMLLEKIGKGHGKRFNAPLIAHDEDLVGLDELEKFAALMAMNTFSIKDTECAATYGSFLIEMANVIRVRFPMNYDERAMLIAAGAKDGISSLMAFIQISLMEMAGYVVIDGQYQPCSLYNMDYFAPPGAICSPGFYREGWTDVQVNVIMQSLAYGLPDGEPPQI